jgi:hypothetical protein
MDSFDLITALDATIDSLAEPLLNRHATDDPNARQQALDLGLHLLDRGCSIVARAGLDLAGLDIAVVAAQDRAHKQGQDRPVAESG